jgi:hypothetical protein
MFSMFTIMINAILVSSCKGDGRCHLIWGYVVCFTKDIVSTPACLGLVTSTYTVFGTEWYSFSISAFCCNGYARRSSRLQISTIHCCERCSLAFNIRCFILLASLITLTLTSHGSSVSFQFLECPLCLSLLSAVLAGELARVIKH